MGRKKLDPLSYQVISAEKLQELEKLVHSKMLDGWRPVGGVSVSDYWNDGEEGLSGAGPRTFLQAMVKDEDDKT